MKILRNQFIVLFSSLLIFFTSCNQYDSLDADKLDSSAYNTAKVQLEGYYSVNNQENKSNKEVIVLNKGLMHYLQEQNNTNYEFSDTFYRLNNEKVEVNFNHAINSGFLKQSDLIKFDVLVSDIENFGFPIAIINFETKINKENLTTVKSMKYDILIQSLNLAYEMNDNLLRPDSSSGCDWIDCSLATVGFAAACVCLATLEVGTVGLATAFVVIGYIAASAAWVRTCQDCF